MSGGSHQAPPKPQIVGDFEYEDVEYLVVFWPAGAILNGEPESFSVYRADLPWSWKHDAEDVRS
jgi:hypothetical protein